MHSLTRNHVFMGTAAPIGTVGRALTGLKVKFSSEQELLIKSPSLMKGYYKEPELTKDTFDEDGYLNKYCI